MIIRSRILLVKSKKGTILIGDFLRRKKAGGLKAHGHSLAQGGVLKFCKLIDFLFLLLLRENQAKILPTTK